MQRLPPLNTLRAFCATARAGSVSAAAAELSLTHSAVSHQLRSLETWLGNRLFTRHADGMRLTDSGTRLYDCASTMLESLAQVCDDIRQGPAKHSLSLGSPGSLMLRCLISHVQEFESSHPGVTLSLREGADVARVRAGQLDAVIYCGREDLPADLHELGLQANAVGPVCTPGLATHIHGVSDLTALPLLASQSFATAWQHWLDGQPSTATNAALPAPRRFDHFIYMIQAAVAGLGVGLAPRVLVREELSAGRLVAPLGFVQTQDRISLVMPARRAKDPMYAALAAWLKQRLAGDA